MAACLDPVDNQEDIQNLWWVLLYFRDVHPDLQLITVERSRIIEKEFTTDDVVTIKDENGMLLKGSVVMISNCSDVKELYFFVYYTNGDLTFKMDVVEWSTVVTNKKKLIPGDEVIIRQEGFEERTAIIITISNSSKKLEEKFELIGSHCWKKQVDEHNRQVGLKEQQLRDEIEIMDREIAQAERIRAENEQLKKSYNVLCEILKDFTPNMDKYTEIVSKIDGEDIILFGSQNTKIKKQIFKNINWKDASAATKTLLTGLFSDEILATCRLSGRYNTPQGPDTTGKKKLDPNIVADIVEIVSKRCNVTSQRVKNYIAQRCDMESKRFKKRNQKMKKSMKLDDDVVKGEVVDEIERDVDRSETYGTSFNSPETSGVKKKNEMKELNLDSNEEQIPNSHSFQIPTTSANQQAMKMLSAENVADIIELVTSKCSVTNEDVNNYIKAYEHNTHKKNIMNEKQQSKPSKSHGLKAARKK